MDLESLAPERVEDVFARNGANAITFSDAGDDPVFEPAPGETPLWRATRITGLFQADADLTALRNDLLQDLSLAALPAHRIEVLEDRAWEREWLKDFRPMRFGEHLWICPSGFEIDDPQATVIMLDPGLAFGTGTHATTALCLEWLDGISVENRSVLDYGCGSGVLAIAALLSGASHATGLDIDRQALVASRQNAVVNGVVESFSVIQDAAKLDARYDVVLANILAGTLIEHAAEISQQLAHGGQIALSGILEEQIDAVADAYGPWIAFGPVTTRDGWACLTGTRS
ncbi:MAG: 50S ribosomal protein L11 methyltransferase [Gammaproteobacteria bacterium]|nr:50S ribosomal protein L11 methyltransferase [Gammaproteobacteria bacterium]